MDNRVELVRGAVTNPSTPWVLFSHGTVVFLPGQSEELEKTAVQVLKDWGPVQVGTPSGDFRVIGFDGGWFIGCHHPDMLTLVTPDQISAGAPDPEIGLLGRSHRAADAEDLQVVHIQEALVENVEEQPDIKLSDDPKMAEAQKALLKGNPVPMTEHLMAGGHWLSLEKEGAGATVYRERLLPTYLAEPWSEYYSSAVTGRYLTLKGPRGLEVRTGGAFYTITPRPVPEFRMPMMVVGVEHTGKMRGAAAQAILTEYGPGVEKSGQIELTQTDRSLGTVVFTSYRSREGLFPPFWLAHVVSTPKHTPKSPGWLKLVPARILDKMVEFRIREVVIVALGTNGGISSEDCASIMIGECQRWFEQNNDVALRVVFSIPDTGIRKAFEAEFRRRKLFFSEA